MQTLRENCFLREKRDRDSLVNAERLHLQKVKENSERSPRRDRLFIGRIVLLPPSLHPTSCLQVFGVCVKQRSGTCGSRRHQEEPCWCGSDRLPSVSTGFRVQWYSSDPPFTCFHMSDLHVMLVFMFNQIKFKCFTCLPPRDPVQQEKPVFPSSGIRARFRLRIACIKASQI